jgi:hypothetical protein
MPPLTWSGQGLNLRPLDPQSVLDGPALTVTCRAAFGLLPPRMPEAVCVAARLRCHRRATAAYLGVAKFA